MLRRKDGLLHVSHGSGRLVCSSAQPEMQIVVEEVSGLVPHSRMSTWQGWVVNVYKKNMT